VAGDPDFAVSAAASSGLPVSFSASGSCTVSAGTAQLTGAGSCTITASQSGDGNYNPATPVSQSFSIARAGQTIVFGPLANKTYGDPDFAVSASASSGLAVSFAASANCTVSGSTVHLTGAGSCTVTSSQPGNANYNAAPPVSQSFSIATKAPLQSPTRCTVPRVIGKPLGAAKLTIRRSHCRTGKVGYAYSRIRRKGIVISQSRRPGRVLPANSKINLVVSRGRKRLLPPAPALNTVALRLHPRRKRARPQAPSTPPSRCRLGETRPTLFRPGTPVHQRAWARIGFGFEGTG
jgi:PASTA domain